MGQTEGAADKGRGVNSAVTESKISELELILVLRSRDIKWLTPLEVSGHVVYQLENEVTIYLS